MSKYTTGEIAKLCGVSVRTVQYYDSRGILIPSQISEGGRRLYSDNDLRLMKIICFLRELDLPIKSIGELLSENNPEKVISILLSEQELVLQTEIAEKQFRLDKLKNLKHSIKCIENFSVESIIDIVHIMENKKKLKKLRTVLICCGIIMDLIEILTLILWIKNGIWQPFIIGMCVCLTIGILISRLYFKKVAYICPQCHSIFKPVFKQFFWSKHTPNTRKLTCTVCGNKGFCVETYSENKEN